MPDLALELGLGEPGVHYIERDLECWVADSDDGALEAFLDRHARFDHYYEQTRGAGMAKAAKMAGLDYHFGGSDEDSDDTFCDLDLGPGGLVVESGSGHAAENDPTKGR